MLQGYNCVSGSVYISWKHVTLPKKYVAKSGRGWKILLLFMKALRGNLHVHISIKTCSKNVSLFEQNLNESHIIRDWVLNFISTFSIDLMHWRHKGSHLHNNDARLVSRSAHVLCWQCALALSLSVREPGGVACRGFPPGCMLGNDARGSASFDPQRTWAPFCDVICIWSIREHSI